MAGALSSPRSVVVEFVGLPGVGKSHVNRLLAARLAERGAPVRSTYLRVNHELGPLRRVLYKSLVVVGELVRRPAYSLRLGAAVWRSEQQVPMDAPRLTYNWLTAQGLVRRGRERCGAELLDEGVLQALWSVGLAGADHAVADCARAALGPDAGPLPDVVVVVDAPLDVILERLGSRASRDGRVDRMDVSERRGALQRGADVLARVVSEEVGVVGGPPRPVLRHVSNADPAAREADLDALVRELTAIVA